MKLEAQPVPFAGCLVRSPAKKSRLVLMGICDDSQSSFLQGAAEAPPNIRSAYDGRCYNSTTEEGFDLSNSVLDLGDLRPLPSWSESAAHYRRKAGDVFANGRIPFVAGGDHAVTIPLLEALSDLGEPVHIVQIDAHPDLYSRYEGNRNSHACVGARALEMEHIATLTGIGIRSFNAAQRQQAERHRGRYFELSAENCAGTIPELSHLNENTPVYVTLDLDAFDPAFAPGVSHPVPGGLTPRQVLHFFHRSRWRLVGMDAVEVNPSRDEHNRTAILAARLLHEGMGIASRGL